MKQLRSLTSCGGLCGRLPTDNTDMPPGLYLLASREAAHCIPNLQLDLLGVDVDHASSKLNANRQVVHWLKAFVRKLKEQT